ncbi:MAG: PD-(D/E)XK nuclease family protein [Treponema sp.]|nr:PD-(D/E)XK nuclease family protein [Treponema sp.]
MNLIETILFENIDNPNSLFIFPTDIAVSRWADQLLRLKGSAITMDKFTAWDKFKQNSIRSKVQNKKSIPSALKKIFISRLVKENSEAVKQGKEQIFSSLIRVEWAFQSSQFAPWLSRLLPQLGIWFNKVTNLPIHSILNKETQNVKDKLEGDFLDMYTLAYRYAHFLETNNLFEPAWEVPPFNNEGKDCFLFFPESLSDYSEYRDILSESGHVKIISLTDTENLKYNAFYYTNARREITEASLYIRSLNEKQNISWDSIAVCIADTEGYESYVLREFENRNIPYVKRTSKPLTDYPAGRFFQAVINCVSQNFSFTSFTSLITNKNLPWKDVSLIDELIEFGIKNNCLYSWTEETNGTEQYVNVWEDAFKKPITGFNPLVHSFYNNLSKRLRAFRSADSFAELRKQYFIFREQFFDMDSCSDETDIVLSRCISELMNLVELEKNFPETPAVDPFLFLLEYLKEVSYLTQTKKSGVNILPYKTAASAPFACHIILGAGQNNLSVIYTRLDFLTRKKREELSIFDEDASLAYINLHIYNSLKSAAFFCSEQTFSGYSIAHSMINVPAKAKENYAADPQFKDLFSKDHYHDEHSLDESIPAILHENQINGFTEWKNRRNQTDQTSGKSENINEIVNYIHEKLTANSKYPDKYSVSASSLKTYYQCSLYWLFERILNLKNVQAETTLMAQDLSGIVYHYALELFLEKIKNKPLIKPEITERGQPSLPLSYSKLLNECVDYIFDGFPSISLSSLSARFIKAGKRDFLFNLEKCLSQFLALFSGSVVVGCETWYQAERNSFYLNGKLDCILKDKNGKYIIIDFKMASLPKRNECLSEILDNEDEVLGDFQLPMYIILTEENEKTEVHTALFYSILFLKTEVIVGSVHDIITEIDYPKKQTDRVLRTDNVYSGMMDLFNKKTQQFADEIRTGNLTVYETDSDICLNCAYNSICRKVYSIKNEKNITLRKS